MSKLTWRALTLNAIVPDWPDVPQPSEMGADRFMDEFLRGQPWPARVGLQLLFCLLAFAPVFVVRRPRPLWRLAPADRERYLAAWLYSPWYWVRMGAIVLKTQVMFLWAAHPAVQAKMGCKQPGQRASVEP